MWNWHEGKVALVTGGSRGIGRSISLKLAHDGADIVIVYLQNEEAAANVKSEIEKLGRKAWTIRANVGNPKEIKLIFDLIAEIGRVDILVHNAALGAFKPVTKLKPNQWDLTFDVNTKALLWFTQSAMKYMESQGGGAIVSISSLGAYRCLPNYGAIGISKAALESLTRYLAMELAGLKVRVNCVSAGVVDTDVMNIYPELTLFKDEIVRRTPWGRVGKPEDIAKVVSFIVSNEAEWITGQTIVADGGLSLI